MFNGIFNLRSFGVPQQLRTHTYIKNGVANPTPATPLTSSLITIVLRHTASFELHESSLSY